MHDSELIQAVRAGDREAFGRLVERHQAALYRLCLRVTGNVPDAEELDAKTLFPIALDAAIRALPALQPYDEATLSRHIGQVCADWAGTRRCLVDERLMRREGGVYQFTEWGEAVWRVERFLRKQYLSEEGLDKGET